MRDVIIGKIENLGRDFADDLMGVENETLRRRKDADDKLQELVEQEKNLKEQEKANKRSLEAHKAKLTEEIEKQNKAIHDLNQEMSRYTKLCNETEKKERKANDVLKVAEEIKKEITREIDRQMKKTREYQDKIDVLKQDDELMDKKKRDYEQRERRIITKEKVNLRDEKRNIDRGHELDERDLDVKLKEKKILLEYKRLKLG